MVGQGHYISGTTWDQVCKPMMNGGLGIRTLKMWNIFLWLSWIGKFLTQPSKLSVQILKKKYCKGTNLMNAIPNQSHSAIWRDMLKGRDLLKQGMIYNIGNGEDISLWYHHLVGDGPLYKHQDIVIPETKAHWRVAHIIQNRKWNLDPIAPLLPHDIIVMIKAIPLPKYASVPGGIRWIFSKDGNFTIKSTYHNLEPNKESLLLNSNLWPKLCKINAPFKYKILLWNVVHKILPTTTILSKENKQL